mmetsp:Transcript_56126/g.134543  ORF Transcript_56126/g.134543 Transcript_56126/m.134543 type:complete len:276 (+) Transcript_56126:130-957(+)
MPHPDRGVSRLGASWHASRVFALLLLNERHVVLDKLLNFGALAAHDLEVGRWRDALLAVRADDLIRGLLEDLLELVLGDLAPLEGPTQHRLGKRDDGLLPLVVELLVLARRTWSARVARCLRRRAPLLLRVGSGLHVARRRAIVVEAFVKALVIALRLTSALPVALPTATAAAATAADAAAFPSRLFAKKPIGADSADAAFDDVSVSAATSAPSQPIVSGHLPLALAGLVTLVAAAVLLVVRRTAPAPDASAWESAALAAPATGVGAEERSYAAL